MATVIQEFRKIFRRNLPDLFSGAQIYGIWRMQDSTWLADLQRGPLSSLNRYELLRSDGELVLSEVSLS